MLVLPNVIYRSNAIPARVDFLIFGGNCLESKIRGLEVKWTFSINYGHIKMVQFILILL